MTRFILIDNKNSLLLEPIKNFFDVKGTIDINNMVVLYIDNTNIDDVISTIKALALDLLINDRIYVSGNKNKSDDELNLALNYILKLDKGLNLPPAILKIASDKISALKILLANYYNDHSFKLLLDTYFTNNLNVLLSATSLYMHRNTLLYKINSFYEHTGFNLKNFKDASLLYIYYD